MRSVILAISSFCCAGAYGIDIDSIPVDRRITDDVSVFQSVAAMPFMNPALKPVEKPYSLSTAKAGYGSDLQSRPLCIEEGRGERKFFFDAETYIHSGASAVWGNARYENGKILDLRLVESPDYHIVAPYAIADTIGGDQNVERYIFGGGYAHEGKLFNWGVEIGYAAGLYYRNVDPRPKSITGKLDVGLGIAFRTGDYLLGPMFRFERYRQTTDIEFVSEMGASKLFHTTGLGTHYARFDGTGSNVFSDYYSYTAGADFYPRVLSGAFVSGRMAATAMRHVIADLNKLPMANRSIRMASLMAGYTSRGRRWQWKAYAGADAVRIHGKENLFGDPTSGSYPVIGNRLAYADNSQRMYAGGCVAYAEEKWNVSAASEANYSHRLVAYVDPRREWRNDRLDFKLDMVASFIADARWSFSFSADMEFGSTVKSALTGIPHSCTDPVDEKFRKALREDFSNATTACRSAGLSMKAVYSFNPRYAVALSPAFKHTDYSTGIIGNEISCSLQFIF